MQNVIYVNMFQQKFDDPNITRLPAPPIEVQRGRSFEVFGLSSSDLKRPSHPVLWKAEDHSHQKRNIRICYS